MQIYTKILIGMAIGVLIGVFAGPKSSFLDRDVYRLGEGSTITVDEASCPPSTNVPSGSEGGCNGVLLVPAGLSIDLVRKELLDEQVADESGKTHKVPMKVSGTITVTERLLLKATGNTKALLKKLNLKPGDELSVKYRLRPLVLPSEVRSLPEPISGLGDTITSSLSPLAHCFLS